MSAGVKIMVTLSACNCMYRKKREGSGGCYVYVRACLEIFYYAPCEIECTVQITRSGVPPS